MGASLIFFILGVEGEIDYLKLYEEISHSAVLIGFRQDTTDGGLSFSLIINSTPTFDFYIYPSNVDLVSLTLRSIQVLP